MNDNPLTRWTKNGTKKSTAPRHDDLGSGRQHEPVQEKHSALVGKDIHIVDNSPTHELKSHFMLPALNELYDTLGSTKAWRYSNDAYAVGTITTVANNTVTVPVQLVVNAPWKQNIWPGAVQIYPVLHFFSICPQGAIATAGAITALYIDNSGITVPLGAFVSSGSYTNTNDVLIPSAITDTGQTTLGLLQITLTGTTPSVGTYSWQLAIGAAYLLPAKKGYSLQEVHHEKKHH